MSVLAGSLMSDGTYERLVNPRALWDRSLISVTAPVAGSTEYSLSRVIPTMWSSLSTARSVRLWVPRPVIGPIATGSSDMLFKRYSIPPLWAYTRDISTGGAASPPPCDEASVPPGSRVVGPHAITH